MATPAPAAKAALLEATLLWPHRSKESDGIMGDARHARTTSDHNTGNAFDLTHDPARGCDAHGLAAVVRARRDPRVKYIISRGRIWNPDISPNWRTYSGSNPHDKHAHFSIRTAARNDTGPWWGPAVLPERSMPVTITGYVTSLAAPNGGVWHLQKDGGIVTADNGLDPATMAPFLGSIPGVGGLPKGRASVGLIPFRGGYAVVVLHADATVSLYHFPG